MGSSFKFRRGIPEDVRWAFLSDWEVTATLPASDAHKLRKWAADLDDAFDRRVKAARQSGPPSQEETGQRAPDAPVEPKFELSRDGIGHAVQSWLSKRLAREKSRQFGFGDEVADGDEAIHRLSELGNISTHLDIAREHRSHTLETIWVAESIAARNGWLIKKGSTKWHYLADAVEMAQRSLIDRVRKELSPSLEHISAEPLPATLHDHSSVPSVPQVAVQPVALMALYDAYLAESPPKAATQKAWRLVMQHLIDHLGHDDASRVSPKDLVSWKEVLLGETKDGKPVRVARTVRDKYLAAAKRVFGWAKSNQKLPTNPCEGISLLVKKPPRLRPKGLTDEEANLILTAALRLGTDSPHREQSFARRWVPWLCAYTGARVAEITQLRGEDVSEIEGVWCIRITPEAGTQKTNEARIVPLHPHLIEQGFPAAVKGLTGPLFYEPKRHRGGSDGNPQYKKVAERLGAWVRSIGVTDRRVQPNHGWRHRFKTQARKINMHPEIRDAIQGHATTSEAQDYGDNPVAWLAALSDLPRYQISLLAEDNQQS